MADTVLNIAQGGATLFFAPYIAPIAGAEPTGHSFADIGAIVNGVSIDFKRDYKEWMSDHHNFPLDLFKQKDGAELKGTMEESTLENMAIAMDQAAGNVSGTLPNRALIYKPNDPRQLMAMKIVAPGLGTNRVATWLFWRGVVTDIGPIPYKREGSEVLFGFTFKPLAEILITNASTSPVCRVTFS